MNDESQSIISPEEALRLQSAEKQLFNKQNNVAGEIEVTQSASLRILIHSVMNRLTRSFPGYDWLVSANDKTGVVDIYLPEMGGNRAYTLHITKLDGNLKKVVKAGGEILERFGLSRQKANIDQLATLERNFKGEAVQK